jgi:hypothetical protein
MVSHVVRHPELHGISGSVLGYPGEPVFPFAAQNAPARNILNQVITSGLRTRGESLFPVQIGCVHKTCLGQE